MSRSDEEVSVDGGQPDAAIQDGDQVANDLFTQVSKTGVEETRLERVRRVADSYVVAPFMIGWEDWRTRFGGMILLFYIAMAIVGPMVNPEPAPFSHPPWLTPFHEGWFAVTSASVAGVSLPWFELEAVFGTNHQGRSMEQMIIYGSVPIFKMIASGALFSVFLGTFLGVLSGYKGGRLDGLIMMITDIVLVVPGLALVVVIAAAASPENPYVVGLILGIDNWPGLTRAIRSQVLSIREESYIEAHRALGLYERTIMRRDIVSQLMPYISINFANGARRIIFESIGLYFIGILPFASQNWGVILNTAYQQISLTDVDRLYYLFIPMLTITSLSVGLILFAQGLDKVFNVRLQARHQKRAQDDEPPAE